jgi:hypothetical protein
VCSVCVRECAQGVAEVACGICSSSFVTDAEHIVPA